MRTILSLTAVAGLTLALMTGSVAATKSSKSAAPPKCKACGMKLSAKKTKEMSRAVKIGSKTYYCCSGCDMKQPKA
jgi:hypothetical protein